MSVALLFAALLQTAPAPPAPPPEKKICRRDTATGSIMTKRTCRTRAEWKKIDAAVAAMTDQTLRQRSNGPNSLSER